MSRDDRIGSSLQDDRSCQTSLSQVIESHGTVVPTLNTPTTKTRKCYLRMCKKLRTPPLTRFTKQIGHVIIDMNSAALRCKDTHAICTALMRQHELECLNFSDNALLPKTLSVIYKLMATKRYISQLDLSNNQLGGGNGSGMELVADIAADNVCLRYLDISGNNVSDADAHNIGRLIKEGVCLWELKMNHNQLREKGGMQIGEAIALNDTLYVLDLSWNHLRGRGAECVALGLMKNSNLVKLDVAWNGFAFEGSVAMAYALKKNTTLTDLNMASNRIHPPALWELWKGVTENKVIRKISISQNPISAIATTPLMFMVRNKLENGLEFLDMSGIVVDKEFDDIVKEIQNTRPDFHVLYDRSLPIHKDKWTAMSKASQVTYNVDPVRILFFAKKNLRIIDMFNKMDTDGDCRLTKTEVYQALKREDYSLSSQSIDAIFSFLDVDGDGYLDLSELMLGERRLKRRIIAEARVARERDKLEVERGEDGMKGDSGGFGGRFSKTYRADASQMPSFDPEHPNLTPSPNRLPKIPQSPRPSPRK